MKNNYTHITVILDRSGSMSTIKDDTIGGFNTFLEEQKEVEGECTISFVQFDTQDPYEVINDFTILKEAKELDGKTFVPRGGTPLYDAIGRGINDIGAKLENMDETNRPEKVIFVILTDGEENSSHEFTQKQVFKMIKEQTDKYNWEFIYLGANQDAMAVGRDLGIKGSSSMTYASNTLGTTAAFDSMSKGMTRMRQSVDMSSISYFDENDRKKQEKAGV